MKKIMTINIHRVNFRWAISIHGVTLKHRFLKHSDAMHYVVQIHEYFGDEYMFNFETKVA